MNRVVHFEIHASDLDKVSRFYADVFGWQIRDMGPQMGNYRLVTTGTEARGIDGGITPRRGNAPKGGEPVNAYVCVISVDDIDGYIAKAKGAGGVIALDKMEVPGVGHLAYMKDPDGNLFGMLQPVQA